MADTMTPLVERIEAASDEPDPYWDCAEGECANCGGEGFTLGCSWDWQCNTYEAGEGTCLCTRRCDWCSPRATLPARQSEEG